jgi:hypothetical protein
LENGKDTNDETHINMEKHIVKRNERYFPQFVTDFWHSDVLVAPDFIVLVV